MRRDACGKTAFTLIELLVVVAIIAVLVSLLLPALIGARGQAPLVAEQSGLRQWGVAHVLHANENDDWFAPTPRGDPGSPELVHTGGFVSYFLNHFRIDPAAFYCPLKPAKLENMVLWDYYTLIGYNYFGRYEDYPTYFHHDYKSPVRVSTSEPWWVLMSDECRGWASQTNHFFGDTIGTNVLCVDGHVVYQEFCFGSTYIHFDAGNAYWQLWDDTRR